MNVKPLTVWCVLWSCLALCGAESLLDSSFRNVNPKDGQLRDWVQHPWAGFKPFAALSVKADPAGKGNVLSVRSVKAKHGTVVRTRQFFRGKSGDTVLVTVRARGKGKASLSIYQYGKKSRFWNPPLPAYKFNLTPQWDTYVYAFRLTNGPSGETGYYQVCIGCTVGSEMDISSVSADLTEGKYRGEIRIPAKWTVFGPMDKNYEPSEAELKTIPEQLNNVKAKVGFFAGSKLDFAPLLNGKGVKKCGWAFFKLKSAGDQVCTLAAGADWWMKVYVNGKVIFDTLKEGNVKGEVSSTPYIADVPLKKGENIVAVKILTGLASSDFYFRSSEQLRAAGGNIRLHKIAWVENFDAAGVQCTGKVQQIQGHPTPGLLTMTGQGVYTPSAAERIERRSAMKWSAPGPDSMNVTSVRIQNFGQEVRKNGSLSLNYVRGGQRFAALVEHNKGSDLLTVKFLSGNTPVSVHKVPYRILPADFLFGADSKGNYALQINSLADSSSRCFRGVSSFFLDWKDMRSFLELTPGKKGVPMEVVIDNYLYGTAVPDTKELHVPFTIERSEAFDPVKAKWPLVFSDDFNGDKLDETKWRFSAESQRKHVTVKDGMLTITADWSKNKKRIESASLYSRKNFLYGYFEARIRFRRESGWWSAFWLCCQSPSNPYMNGFEIDIYEDYYLSRKVKDGPYGNVLDHNLHINAAGTLKSFNYHSKLPGTLDDFYVIGCKWTPFEISYYINGKLIRSQANHSPYDSVTFDAFHHGNGVAPIMAILSGCCGRSGGNPKLGKFPDYFKTDYVRVYAYPGTDKPAVEAKYLCSEDFVLKAGDRIKVQVKAKAVKGNRIKTVYLMDSGYLLDYKTKPPYNFEIPLTAEYYNTTHFVKPGRSGQRPEFLNRIHAWSVFVQDDKGNVAYTKPMIRYVGSGRKSTPYKGTASVIPGTVYLGRYDEGGMNVAYYDTTAANVFSKTYRKGEGVDVGAENGTVGGVAAGEWLNYTVDVKQSGRYLVKFHYGSPLEQNYPTYLIDSTKVVGVFHTRKHKASHWGVDSVSVVKDVRLKKGVQTLKLFFLNGLLNATKLEFIYQGK